MESFEPPAVTREGTYLWFDDDDDDTWYDECRNWSWWEEHVRTNFLTHPDTLLHIQGLHAVHAFFDSRTVYLELAIPLPSGWRRVADGDLKDAILAAARMPAGDAVFELATVYIKQLWPEWTLTWPALAE